MDQFWHHHLHIFFIDGLSKAWWVIHSRNCLVSTDGRFHYLCCARTNYLLQPKVVMSTFFFRNIFAKFLCMVLVQFIVKRIGIFKEKAHVDRICWRDIWSQVRCSDVKLVEICRSHSPPTCYLFDCSRIVEEYESILIVHWPCCKNTILLSLWSSKCAAFSASKFLFTVLLVNFELQSF